MIKVWLLRMPAWWPSSVSGDNRTKDWINDNIYIVTSKYIN